MTDGFPYLLICPARGGPRRVPVIFVGEEVRPGPEAFAFAWAGPQRDGSGDLTPECRAALVEAVKPLVRGTGDTALICLDYHECISIEGPDGLVQDHRAPSWLGTGAGPERHSGRSSVEEDEEAVDERPKREHPHIVTKGGAPMCGFSAVEVLQVASEVPPTFGVFTVIYPGQSTDEAGRLTPGCRSALVEAVRRRAASSGFRLCVVFAEGDAVYVEPDGSAVHSATPPGWRGQGPLRQRVEGEAVVTAEIESQMVH